MVELVPIYPELYTCFEHLIGTCLPEIIDQIAQVTYFPFSIALHFRQVPRRDLKPTQESAAAGIKGIIIVFSRAVGESDLLAPS